MLSKSSATPRRRHRAVSAYQGDLELDIDGHVAKSIAAFAAQTSARDRVPARVPANPAAKLAVGRDLADDIKITVLRASLIALGGPLAAAAIGAASRRRPPGGTT